MILVDTSIWIDHLHAADPGLVEMLGRAEVVAHPLVVEELAMGSIRGRGTLLDALADLPRCEVLTHPEILALVGTHELWGKGLSPVDAHLIGSALLSQGVTKIWTRDKALDAESQRLNVAYPASPSP